jgi:hypothetical protein
MSMILTACRHENMIRQVTWPTTDPLIVHLAELSLLYAAGTLKLLATTVIIM